MAGEIGQPLSASKDPDGASNGASGGAPKPPVDPKRAAEQETSTWFARIEADERTRKLWEEGYRVDDCYAYWRGRQRRDPMDQQGERKAQTNLIHPQVRAQLPALYFYRPYARVTAEPARNTTPMSSMEDRMQLLQDTGNYLASLPETRFRASTFLGLKEQFWSFGCVEVGYSASFADDPQAERPPLKENEDTKVPPAPVGMESAGGEREVAATAAPAAVPGPALPALSVPMAAPMPLAATGPAPGSAPAPAPAPFPPAAPVSPSPIDAELAALKARFRSERFFVKHISAKQVMISASDKPILEDNDWVGYWEDYNLEDVKAAKIYSNTATLKASTPSTSSDERDDAAGDDVQFREASADGSLGSGSADAKKIRLYKIWDLRTKTKIVLAHKHKYVLLKTPFKRCPLKFLRPDLDPYHFRPVPPIYNGLDAQDIHNNSFEYLRKTERATKARWTYDERAMKKEEIEKFERDEANYIPRAEGSVRPIEPIEHPQFTQLPMQIIALSERNFAQATGVPAEARQGETTGEKTATQAMIQNTAAQVVDSFDRATVAEWLASIIEELILLARDNMQLPQWVAMHVDRESPLAIVEATQVAKTYREIRSEDLELAMSGITWHVAVDVESISPIAEQEQLQRMLQMLNFIGNPTQALLLSKAPILLDRLLDLAGFKGGRNRDAILEALGAVVQFAQTTTAPGGGGLPGLSPMPGAPAPVVRVPAGASGGEGRGAAPGGPPSTVPVG